MRPAMSRLSSAIECAFHNSRTSRYSSGVTSRDSSSRASTSPFPALGQLDLQTQMIQDSLHHEVHEITHLARLMIEAWGGRQDDRARLRRERHVPEMDERQRHLAGDEQQLTALLEHDVRGA